MPQDNAQKMVVLGTGETKAWDAKYQPISPSGTGQDAEYKKGEWIASGRFEAKNGAVYDKLTGLTWLQDADYFGEVAWDDALAKSNGLQDGQAGLTDGSKPGDWRLANLRELLSLIDYGQSSPILSKPNPFRNVRIAIYWTSTSLTPAAFMAWMMTLGIGPTVFDVKRGNRNHMWPVKGDSKVVPQTGQTYTFDINGNPSANVPPGQDGQFKKGVPLPPGATRFHDNGDGTVTDTFSGLIWLKNANPFGMVDWQTALQRCQTLQSGQFGLTDNSKPGNWRLPNIREAESVVDYGAVGPCVPNGGKDFTDLRPSSYWTSTSVTAAPSEAMFIIYGVGPSIFEGKEQPFFVWPVRDPLK